MRIICKNTGCIYHELGECNLKRAAQPGTCDNDGCVYYIQKQQ